MDTIIGIGWDVGGWQGDKQGIAVVKWDSSENRIVAFVAAEEPMPAVGFTSESLFEIASELLLYG